MARRAALASIVLALAGCGSGSDGRPAGRSPATTAAVRDPAALVLLHDGRLVRVSLLRGEVDRVVRIGPRRAGPAWPGQRLAPYRGTVFALGSDRVVALDAATLRRRASHRLDPRVDYAGIVAGRSGTVYAYGNRRTRRGRWQVVVTRVDGSRRQTVIVRAAERLPGVYWGAISADERRLLLSYHGGPDGADWFDVQGRLARCEPPRRRFGPRVNRCLWLGKKHVHGAIAPYGTGFLAATGRSRLIAVDGDGRLTDTWDPRTGDAHLMMFALDADRRRAVVASCEGIEVVDLARDRLRVLPRRRACAETPLALHGDRALLARGRRLVVFDLARRRAVARLTVPAEPLAAVVMGP